MHRTHKHTTNTRKQLVAPAASRDTHRAAKVRTGDSWLPPGDAKQCHPLQTPAGRVTDEPGRGGEAGDGAHAEGDAPRGSHTHTPMGRGREVLSTS